MFDKYCADEGIVRHKTLSLTSQENGLVERMNRTLMKKLRCMMFQAKLPISLWAETLNTTCYLMNLSPSSAISFKTPYKMWTRQTPSYAHLKVFGCQAYAYVNQGKLAPRALKSVFIGYPNELNGTSSGV